MDLPFELLTAGYCTADRRHALRGSPGETIRFYATCGLWKHPSKGYVLFDTGYTRRFYNETKRFPASIHAHLTKVYIKEDEEVVSVLKRQGIQPEEVRYIVISHFHADHICGLRDFPEATFICSRDAYNLVKDKKGFAAVRRGFLPGLMPDDIGSRIQLIDFSEAQQEHETLGSLIDLFSDGAILLCSLPGHARGQLGALFTSGNQRVFLVSDAAWLEESYRNVHLPHPVVRLFFDSWSDFKASLKSVHAYHVAHADAIIIPCHCNSTRLRYERYPTTKIWS